MEGRADGDIDWQLEWRQWEVGGDILDEVVHGVGFLRWSQVDI